MNKYDKLWAKREHKKLDKYWREFYVMWCEYYNKNK